MRWELEMLLELSLDDEDNIPALFPALPWM